MIALWVCLAVYCFGAYYVGWRTYFSALSGSPEIFKRALMLLLSPVVVPVLFVALASARH